MNDIVNNSKELEIITDPEHVRETFLSDMPDQNIKFEKKIKRRTAAAKILGIATISMTALRILLCPIFAIAIIVFNFFLCFFLMMGGALVLAMSALAAPYLLPIALVVMLLAIAAIILLEFTPIILGIISTILAASARRIARKREVNCPKCQKSVKGAKGLSLTGLIVSIAAEPIAGIPTFLLFLPLLFLILLAAAWIIQLIGLALA